jgi:hypothetical protein
MIVEMSSLPSASLLAKQQILETDLLQEVLAYLGPDVAECHAALLVNHAWCEALER